MKENLYHLVRQAKQQSQSQAAANVLLLYSFDINVSGSGMNSNVTTAKTNLEVMLLGNIFLKYMFTMLFSVWTHWCNIHHYDPTPAGGKRLMRRNLVHFTTYLI